MSRKLIIAGNWKMNLLVGEAENLVKGLLDGLTGKEECDIVVAPAFGALAPVGKVISGTAIDLAGQDLHWESFGACTGALSI